ncbi:hypothetical protein [Halobacterium sp. CBA1126]|uniref:hypothetical protein n=1 Tax=Halobacterium sp. CBA1126 TaxID=2668074 RepID=UPI0012FC444F|nr:hypothetical protein [Halobacterium sp. CBA1126]MUV59795.1 hypothetical protein [Halobacterium sp. CBA1126]
MATDNDTSETKDDGKSTKRWQRWKVVTLGLGAIAAFLGNLYLGTAAAIGYALGATVIYFIVAGVGTRVYRSNEWMQLGLIPPRVYAGICVVSGAASIPVAIALLSNGAGGFVMMYLLLGGIAFIVQILRRGISRVRRGNPTD